MQDQERRLCIDDQALDWLLRKKNGLDARSEAALRAWLDIDPDHQAAYERWQADWESFDEIGADQLRQLRLQASRFDDQPMALTWLRRVQDACADFWLGPPARRLALGGVLGLLLGLLVLGRLGHYLG